MSSISRAGQADGADDGARRGRVLVVDDEVLLLRAVERLLSADYDVSCAASAREALDRIESGERFDALLCDLMMPALTGMDLHARLLHVDPALAARTVFLTGGAFTAEAREYVARAANPVLHKPFDAATLSGLVEELLSRR